MSAIIRAWVLMPIYGLIYGVVESHARFAPKWFGGFDAVDTQTICAQLLGISSIHLSKELCDEKLEGFLHGRVIVCLSVAFGFALCLFWFYFIPSPSMTTRQRK